MSLKKLGLVAAMMTAMFAIMSASASAAIEENITTGTTVPAVWKTGSTPFGNTEATGKTPVCSAATNLVLKGTILGSEAELTATGVSCSGKLWNEGSGESAMAVGKGTLSFTGITVNKPAGCKLNGEANGSAKQVTETLTISVDMWHHDLRKTEPAGVTTFTGEPVADAKAIVTFNPVGEKFATLNITNCAAEGKYKVTGTGVGESANETGTSAANQKLKFNEMSNLAGSLTLAGNPATITGEANNELVGGEAFQVN